MMRNKVATTKDKVCEISQKLMWKLGFMITISLW